MWTLGLVLLLISNVTSLCEGTLIAKYNRKHSGGGFLFTGIVALCSMLFFVVKGLIGGTLGFTSALLPYAIVCGILYAAASVAMYFALACGSFALSQLILSYGIVMTIIYGLSIGEKPTVFAFIGFAALAVALFLTRASNKDGEKKQFSLKWLVCILIAFLGNGLFVVIRYMQQDRFAAQYDDTFMVLSVGIAVVLLVIFAFARGDHKTFAGAGTLYAVGAGLSNGATNCLSLLVTGVLAFPKTIAGPLGSGLKIVLSFVVSAWLLKEHFQKRQIIGAAVGLAAVILLNFGV